MQTLTLSFFRFDGTASRLWAMSRMQAARRPLARTPGIGFAKLFGSGTGEGFDPWPDLGTWAILATWPSLDHAREMVAEAPVWQAYRAHASEDWTVHLQAVSSRGAWDGVAPFDPAPRQAPPAPIAVITRATIRSRIAPDFWRNVPKINRTLRVQDESLLFRKGLGEVPWLRQVTFSIWSDAERMKAFAYGCPYHSEAIRRVRAGKWFREELYARFAVLGTQGSWQGADPLAGLALAAAA